LSFSRPWKRCAMPELHIYRPGEDDEEEIEAELRRQVRDAMRHLELAQMILDDVLRRLPWFKG